jgi:hypothetical protein
MGKRVKMHPDQGIREILLVRDKFLCATTEMKARRAKEIGPILKNSLFFLLVVENNFENTF